MKLKVISILAGVAVLIFVAGMQLKNAILGQLHPAPAATHKVTGRPKIRGSVKILYIAKAFPEVWGTKYKRHITFFVVTRKPYQTAVVKKDYLFFKDALPKLSKDLEVSAWVNPDSMADFHVNWLDKRIGGFEP